MKIHKIAVGYLKANCYVLEKKGQLIVIDPGDEYDKISKIIKDKEVVKVLITHQHPDHIGALNNFDKNLVLKNPQEGEYSFGPFNFEVISTKGHTDDSVTYYFKTDSVMFTGDFLFKETIGRTDMPGGSMEQMMKSLDKIKTYSNDTQIYPGHGMSTNLKYEKTHNYFLK